MPAIVNIRRIGLLAVALVLAQAGAVSAGSQYSVLYSFPNTPQGINPVAGVTFDAAGNIYGVTTWLNGSVFELTPAVGGGWTATTLYTFNGFNGGNDGYSPWGGVSFDSNGNLYGTTVAGGGTGCFGGSGCGTVFELSPVVGGGWTETVLYRFSGGSDGFGPQANLTLDSAGNLYGTTSWGGDPTCNPGTWTNGCGTVFELSPNAGGGWTETVLHAFHGGHGGAYPFLAGVIFDSAGNVYGTTAGTIAGLGAGEGFGTVFELTHSPKGVWKHQVLYRFPGTNALAYPAAGLVFDNVGNLYGTSQGGPKRVGCCGTVFELQHSNDVWTEKTLHRFTGTDGAFPLGGVTFDKGGNLYGTAPEGGQGNCFAGCGTLIELSPSGGGWTETVLHEFGNGDDASVPIAGVTRRGRALVGTTQWGGATGDGTVYEFVLPRKAP